MELSERPDTRVQRAANVIEKYAQRAGDRIWLAAKHRPILSVALVSTAGIVLSTAIGVAELAVGIGSGYLAYLVFRKGEPPSKALRDTMGIRHG
jgi:hypothetical protein